MGDISLEGFLSAGFSDQKIFIRFEIIAVVHGRNQSGSLELINIGISQKWRSFGVDSVQVLCAVGPVTHPVDVSCFLASN